MTDHDDVNHKRDLIAIKKQRLQALEKQEAHYGIRVDPSIPMEIATLRAEIQALDAQLSSPIRDSLY